MELGALFSSLVHAAQLDLSPISAGRLGLSIF